MWKLIKLEYEKNNTLKYVMKTGIILALFLLFFFSFTFLTQGQWSLIWLDGW